MGMEVCCTLGMINEAQAQQLKEAGLTAYNHNLDTSREYYPKIITTRSYDERLQTIANVRDAGISVCSGGIIGLGETHSDRVGMLHTLSTLPEHPESVPVNALLAVDGTPLEKQKVGCAVLKSIIRPWFLLVSRSNCVSVLKICICSLSIFGKWSE
jgi:biotin synthase